MNGRELKEGDWIGVMVNETEVFCEVQDFVNGHIIAMKKNNQHMMLLEESDYRKLTEEEVDKDNLKD